MIDVIITSFKEPKATLRAAQVFLKDKRKDLRVIVVDPFTEVEKFLKSKIKDKRFVFFLDPGEGKSYALNLLFQEFGSQNKEDIFVMTDGDVYASENALDEVLKAFKNKEVGCVTGRPVPTNSVSTKYGFWASVLYGGADLVRKRLSFENKFFQASGYLFAIRKGIVGEISPDVPEDCIIPYMVWKKDYKIYYADKAEVYVQYPNNWKDWLSQRVRTIKAHENISKFVPDMPRTKSFWNEVKEGLIFSMKQPKSLKQFKWLMSLYFVRLYIYYLSFKDIFAKDAFDPAWRDYSEIDSAKPLD